MAKNAVTNGTKLFTSFFKAIFGVSAGEYQDPYDDPTVAGHLHDGVNEHGHCGRIVLDEAKHVTGKLPGANIAFEGTTPIAVATVGLTSEITNKSISYAKLGNLVIVAIPDGLYGNATGVGSFKLTGNFSAIAPASGTLIPCLVRHYWGSNTNNSLGALRFEGTGTIWFSNCTGSMDETNGETQFEDGPRGVPMQSIAWLKG